MIVHGKCRRVCNDMGGSVSVLKEYGPSYGQFRGLTVYAVASLPTRTPQNIALLLTDSVNPALGMILLFGISLLSSSLSSSSSLCSQSRALDLVPILWELLNSKDIKLRHIWCHPLVFNRQVKFQYCKSMSSSSFFLLFSWSNGLAIVLEMALGSRFELAH